MNINKILLFLLLAFGFSWLGFQLPGWFLDADSIVTPFIQLLGYCWGPALATLIVQKGIYGESMARYGWNRKRFSFNWILATMFLPLGIIFGTVGVVFLLGNLFHLPGFGEVIFGQEILAHNQDITALLSSLGILPESLNPANGPMMPQEMWVLWFIILIAGLIGGATVNLLFNVGEEVGWRGFMLVETKSLGFLGSNLIIGGLWGVWLLPLLSMSSGQSLLLFDWWSLVAVVGFAIAMAFPMAYFSIKTRSIYASATFNGVLNNITLLSAFFIWGENELLGSVRGLAGMFVLLTFTFLIIRYDPKFVEKYDKWVY